MLSIGVLMTYAMIILSAAKAAKVSGALLLAICTHETNLTTIVVQNDGNSPSYGICQIKYATAQMVGFKGKARELIDPNANAKWAARYLSYQLKRYSGDYCKATAAYNAGTYNPSKKLLGKPRNFRYVKKVTLHLENDYKELLACGLE